MPHKTTNNKIVTEIQCSNLAPISNLNKKIESESLKIAIFADNGSGKTFLSSVFRLLERNEKPLASNGSKVSTDKFISFDKKECSFSFKITGKDNLIAEEFKLDIKRGIAPTLPTTNYIFHCFNEAYVEENIYALSCDKDQNIEGFILGKINIDLDNEEKELAQNQLERDALKAKIESQINSYINEKIGSIPRISTLNEYKRLTYDEISRKFNKPLNDVAKTYEELLADYHKIKSVPENLPDILLTPQTNIKIELIDEIFGVFQKEYTLSSFADSFKQKIKAKQSFIESGLKLIKKSNGCPFCEQEFDENALNLIDEYNRFVENEESKAIKFLNTHKESIEKIIKTISIAAQNTDKKINQYTEYKTKFIPSVKEKNLSALPIEKAIKDFELLIQQIEKKMENINLPLKIDVNFKSEICENLDLISSTILENNEKIREINKKKSNIDDESKSVKRDLCKVVFNDLIKINKNAFETLQLFIYTISELIDHIKKIKHKTKISKKEKVANTIETVLKRFFADKYSIDKETFRLSINKTILAQGQAKDVLSQGEKNIIAFAYFLGDIHLKVESEDDYNKLFFIFDDPISSMDFNHVYTVSGVIRDLNEMIGINNRVRYIVFTHHLDFMRVLVGNNVVSKSLVLKDSELKDFNNNLTVPYVLHLHDIYKISKGGVPPSHTTANSIRHIIETLTKFENITASEGAIGKYIKDNFPEDSKTYTLIQDLSHGGWRSEQAPINENSLVEVCKAIIGLIEKKYKGQIDYCGSV